MYLGKGYMTDAWTMTPAIIDTVSTNKVIEVFSTNRIYEDNKIELDSWDIFSVRNKYNVYPVINLKIDVQVINGNGTRGNPYIIKTN